MLVRLVRLPAPEPGEMLQVTPELDGSLFTSAAIDNELPACAVAVAGIIVSVIAATVIVAEADFDVSATEVAVIVTFRSL